MNDIAPYLQRWQGRVTFPLCLAPMVGLSHVVLREVARQYMPAGARTWWPTEMLNSRRVSDETMGQSPETLFAPGEQDLVPQILGNEEAPIARSVQTLESRGVAGIDINMGCPVQKALRHNYGVALMGDPYYASEVVRMTVRNAKVPVSVKLRAGPQGDFDFLWNFVDGLTEAGASWVTLHPRTAEQKRRGSADWGQIAKLRAKAKIPIIGNGDVQTVEDVFAMFDETGCDLVMAGRALAARPWLLWQVGEKIGLPAPAGKTDQEAPKTPEEEGQEFGRVALRWIDESKKYFSDELALRKYRFYVRTTSPWLEFGHTLMSLSTKAKTLDEAAELTRQFFAVPQRMAGRTDLRE